MKVLALITSLVLLSFLSSCFTETVVGPQGPVGPEGPQGSSADNAFVFEESGINFTAPNYEYVIAYPDNFEGFDSDVAVVYLLWDSYTNSSNEVVEVWRQLSQTVLTDQGTLLYNADFSKYDARIFLEADFPRENLTANATDAWIARVVVIPGEFWNSGRIDISDYYAVVEALGLPDLASDREVVKRF